MLVLLVYFGDDEEEGSVAVVAATRRKVAEGRRRACRRWRWRRGRRRGGGGGLGGGGEEGGEEGGDEEEGQSTRVVGAASRSLSTTSVDTSLDRAKIVEDYDRVLQTFANIRACAVFRFKIVKFTLTTPNCLEHLSNFRQKYDGDVMVGCGTIMNTADAERAVDARAEFIITPVMLPDVIEWCVARNIVSVPGCQTPTELVSAYRAGAPLQKLFPGVTGGPMWVKAVSSALPMLSINPTSGVDLDNAGDYLRMGAASVGLVAPLFDPAAIQAGNWDQIAKNAEKVMANVKEAGPYVRK
jgi:Entner-Doudoroff aldolase